MKCLEFALCANSQAKSRRLLARLIIGAGDICPVNAVQVVGIEPRPDTVQHLGTLLMIAMEGLLVIVWG
jgi:hypothetical protein